MVYYIDLKYKKSDLSEILSYAFFSWVRWKAAELDAKMTLSYVEQNVDLR